MAGFAEILGVSDITDKNNIWRIVLAEFLGNLLLNFFGCGSCIYASDTANNYRADQIIISLCFGLVIMAIIQSIGHISGAHVNPAVTVGMLVAGQITILKSVCYIIAQCLGAIAGSAFLKALTPETIPSDKQGHTTLSPLLSEVQGFGIEFVLGFVLVLVVFGVCDPKKPESKGVAPLVIGLTIAMGHLAAVDYTGASMNPARTLGSAVISNVWSSHWVYWLGPILGGVGASLIYKHAFTLPVTEANTEYSPVQLKRLDNRKDEDGMA